MANKQHKPPQQLPPDKMNLLGSESFTVIRTSDWKVFANDWCGIRIYGSARRHRASVYWRSGRLEDTYEE